jgi:N-glycosylase/DNA lyase
MTLRNDETALEMHLRGAGGEPVDLRRTFLSHGVANLPPLFVERGNLSLTMTLRLDRSVRSVVISNGSRNKISILVKGPTPLAAVREQILREVRYVLRLDEDLSEFYARIARDRWLSWAASGAGRMVRSQTVFEEIVKTICTTNCAWSATERMVGALVQYLGKPAPGAPEFGVAGRAFPTPKSMAKQTGDFYREVVRAGYRGDYLLSLARSTAQGDLKLEELKPDSPAALSDDEAEGRLLALPGVGPYAAAHVMMMLGRYSRLILDSWTRPKYASLIRRKTAGENEIKRRFSSYGRYAGLAFWLFLTRDWIEEVDSRP